jgi:hypothetical protein
MSRAWNGILLTALLFVHLDAGNLTDSWKIETTAMKFRFHVGADKGQSVSAVYKYLENPLARDNGPKLRSNTLACLYRPFGAEGS